MYFATPISFPGRILQIQWLLRSEARYDFLLASDKNQTKILICPDTRSLLNTEVSIIAKCVHQSFDPKDEENQSLSVWHNRSKWLTWAQVYLTDACRSASGLTLKRLSVRKKKAQEQHGQQKQLMIEKQIWKKKKRVKEEHSYPMEKQFSSLLFIVSADRRKLSELWRVKATEEAEAAPALFIHSIVVASTDTGGGGEDGLVISDDVREFLKRSLKSAVFWMGFPLTTLTRR